MPYTSQIAFLPKNKQSVKSWRSGVVFRTSVLTQPGILAQWVSTRSLFYILGQSTGVNAA